MFEHSGLLFQVDPPITVAWVPADQVGDTIKAFGYYLIRGLNASDITLEELINNLVSRNCFLGVAYEETPFKPMGIWVSDYRATDDGVSFVTVYALAGTALPRWMPKIEALVTTWGRRLGAGSVRFAGRAAYKSLVTNLNVISRLEDGRVLVFEKRIAA